MAESNMWLRVAMQSGMRTGGSGMEISARRSSLLGCCHRPVVSERPVLEVERIIIIVKSGFMEPSYYSQSAA